MVSELNRDVARCTSHEDERRVGPLRPSLRTNGNIVITVASGMASQSKIPSTLA